jgi:hypothetical protein
MITFTSDQTSQLTVFMTDGRIRLADVKEALEKFYFSQPTQKIIWDLSRADLSGATLEEVEELAKFVKGLAHSREGGRNAIITSKPFAYSLGKMYQLFAELARQTSQTRIFKTWAEAEEWLNS